MSESVSPHAVHPRFIEIVVDGRDPKRLATFWSALMGIGIKGPIIGFQQVPEGKVAKNRMHLDLRVTELDQSAASGRQ